LQQNPQIAGRLLNVRHRFLDLEPFRRILLQNLGLLGSIWTAERDTIGLWYQKMHQMNNNVSHAAELGEPDKQPLGGRAENTNNIIADP